ncbi:MAG: DUF692 domain-containing protein [Polyangiaceae bacterium]|nr:DUF692 domain-containing protein [Myxococcales bacterium]MCB9585005.1 DUF692 domain-containing protein [Polyangiaceae bacterium]MCB9607422.1 DUF692 domain-containing protein [Polyangiaceae bacterium]
MSETIAPRLGVPDHGVGIGLRVPHYRTILETRPSVDFFEVISENFMVPGGKPRYHLEAVLESYKIIQHGVSLGIGSPDPLDMDYLKRLKELVRVVKPAWLSDHFCWGAADGVNIHDLLPLPYTRAAVARVVERAKMVQDFLEVRFALENTSSYLSYTSSQMSEWDFVSEVVERADIGLMFDVNNVFVSAYNHGFDPYDFIHHVPHERIVQIHLAGHTNLGTHIIDTHSGHVIDAVWDLYRETIELTGAVSTLIEWDDEIPELSVVLQEAERAREVRQAALDARALRESKGEPTSPSYVPHPPPRPIRVEEAQHGWSVGGPREHASQEAGSVA